jgi:hypothetical protein
MDQARQVEIRNAVLSDLGGEETISEVLALLVDDFAFACTLRDLLAAHLMAVGPLTKRNAKRAAVDLWHRASARAEGLAKRIGTERRAAHVPSLDEYLKEREREQAPDQQADDDRPQQAGEEHAESRA